MTKAQAIREARRRWGPQGNVILRRSPTTDLKTGTVLSRTHRVGRIVSGLYFRIEGDGDTWEDAFASADRRQQTAAP